MIRFEGRESMTHEATPQLDKFKQLAQRLECDEDENVFEENVKKVAKAPRASRKAKLE
jgi:hypothetical protein